MTMAYGGTGAGAAATAPAAGAAQVSALPRTGVGGLEDSASVNFLLVGSVLMLFYIALGFVIRRGHGRPALEDDGITGL